MQTFWDSQNAAKSLHFANLFWNDFTRKSVAMSVTSWFKWKQSQHKQKLNPNQTHSPIVHQHVQKDAPCHAPGPYSFLQLWSSSCTSCTVLIIQQVKKTHKKSIQISDHFCEAQTFAYWNLRSSLRNKSHRIYYRNPKRQNAIYLSLRCNSHHKGIANSLIWLNRNSQACESLQERNGGEGGYLQMLLWSRECHLALACGWCLEPASLALLPWGTSMVDHQPRPPLIGI